MGVQHELTPCIYINKNESAKNKKMEELLEHIRKNWGKVETCASCDSQIPTGLCAGCLQYSYCGESCQSTHWMDSHQFECIGNDEDRKRKRTSVEDKEKVKGTPINILVKNVWSIIVAYLNADDLKNLNAVSREITKKIRQAYFEKFRVRVTDELFTKEKEGEDFKYAEIFPFIRSTIETGSMHLTPRLPNVTSAFFSDGNRFDWNAILNMTQLQSLRVTRFPVLFIPSRLTVLTNLKYLRIIACGVTEIPPELGQMTSLKRLSFDFNQIQEIPSELGQLTQLEELSFTRNQIREIPEELSALNRLLTFDLEDNRFMERFPVVLTHLTQIQQLSLAHVPEVDWNVILNMKNLTFLLLENIPLVQIPPGIGLLVQLKDLHLAKTNLVNLPPELKILTRLEELHISHNFITELPILVQLRILDVTDNDLTEFPTEMTNLTNLNISENLISELPTDIGKLVRLEVLDVSYNNLTELPDELGNLVNLKELNLEENIISELQPEIGHLTNLTRLNLFANYLTKFPRELRNLVKLQELNAGLNFLEEVTPGIGNLTMLVELKLSNNQLKDLPEEMRNLTRLRTLELHVNPFEDVRKIRNMFPKFVLNI